MISSEISNLSKETSKYTQKNREEILRESSCKQCKSSKQTTIYLLNFSFLIGMNPFVNECILAEKNMNTLPHIEASSSGNTIAILKNMASCTTSNINPAMKHPIADRRTPLGKAYSCSDVQSPTINGKFSFITPRVFHDLITQNYNTHEHKSYPIIDCRSQMDYGCERIKSSYNVNCRAKIMARKLLSKRLEDVEPSLTISLNNSDIVILYDQSTNERSEDKIRLLPINLVIQAVIKSNKAAYIIEGS